MRHRIAGSKLSRPTAQRLALLRNLVTDLFRSKRITTTEAKAKAVRPLAEKMITLAKRGDLHARRMAAKTIYDSQILVKLFSELAEKYDGRDGGYVRVLKLGQRLGDGASMALLELVD